MDKIDWNKPIQVLFNGKWQDVSAEGTMSPDPVAHPILRNKPEPRYIWLNVYDKGPHSALFHIKEPVPQQIAKGYIHTLKVNILVKPKRYICEPV